MKTNKVNGFILFFILIAVWDEFIMNDLSEGILGWVMLIFSILFPSVLLLLLIVSDD